MTQDSAPRSPFPFRPRRAAALRSALGFLAVFLLAGCGDAGREAVGEGVSLELARHRAATLSEIRYDVALSIPENRSDTIRGRTAIDFAWSDPERRPVVVDFKDPGERVDSVTVNGVAVAWRPEADHVVIPAAAFREGENRLVLVHAAGDEALNRSDDFLYTLFVPDRAHFSLPVFDQPDLKARVSWTLEIPRGWVAVANGPSREAPLFPRELAGRGVPRELVEVASASNAPGGGSGPGQGVEDAGDGDAAGAPGGETVTWRFMASRPIPTYLMAFAAGRFQVEMARRGKYRFTMFHRETDTAAVARNRDAIFELHRASLDWLEEYTDLPYPFQKFDFVLLPPFQYGGMEHPGSIFYRQSSLMLDASATQSDQLGRASLIAHETAHMWFGNLVTMRWFDDVWTKEVFANFMAAKIVNPSFPEVDHRLRFLMAHHPSAWSVDRTPGANAIRQPLENLREAGTLYGAVIYQKAPIVMAHLERTVGPEAFREGMREYLSTHLYGNATWPDLIAILDRLDEDDLAAWSRVWVEEPGRPRILLEPGADGSGVTIRQEDRWGRDRRWPQTLELVGGATVDAPRTSVRLTLADEPRVAWAGEPAPEVLLPLGAGIEYGLFQLDSAWTETLLQRAGDFPEATHRGAAWLILRDAMLEERLAPGRLLDRALAALSEEEDEILVSHLLGLIRGIYWDDLPETGRRAEADRVAAALWQGLEAAPTATGKASWFGAWSGVVETPDGVDRLRRIWAGEETVPGVPLSESQRIRLAEQLAVRGVPDAPEILDAQAAAIENPDRRDRFDFVRPSLSADPAVRETFFNSLLEDGNRDREPWVLAGLGYLQHPLRREHGATLVPRGLEVVEELQRTGDIFFPGAWLNTLLGSHHDPGVPRAVEAFLAAHPDYPPRLRGKILQAYDGARRAARIVHGPDAASPWSVEVPPP